MTQLNPIFKNNEGQGFLAMVLVILTLSLSSSMIIMLMQSNRSNASVRETSNKAESLRLAITKYRTNHGASPGTYPVLLDHLVTTDGGAACAMDNAPASPTYLTLQGWCGPYIDQIYQEYLTDYKTDGWGTTYTWNNATGVITSSGPDRTYGNADDITFNP